MGYYTSYDLVIRPNSKNDAVSKERWDQLEKEIKKMNAFDDGDVRSGFYSYAKWYDCDLDMTKLSMLFPEFLFELHGDGEESTDFWIMYYADGKSQFCEGRIVYDDYDPLAFDPPRKSVDYLQRKYEYEEINKE